MLAHEAFGVSGVGIGEDDLTSGPHLFAPAAVDHLGCQQPDPAVAVMVLTERVSTKGPAAVA